MEEGFSKNAYSHRCTSTPSRSKSKQALEKYKSKQPPTVSAIHQANVFPVRLVSAPPLRRTKDQIFGGSAWGLPEIPWGTLLENPWRSLCEFIWKMCHHQFNSPVVRCYKDTPKCQICLNTAGKSDHAPAISPGRNGLNTILCKLIEPELTAFQNLVKSTACHVHLAGLAICEHSLHGCCCSHHQRKHHMVRLLKSERIVAERV